MDPSSDLSNNDMAPQRANNVELAKALSECKMSLADVTEERDRLQREIVKIHNKYRTYLKDINVAATSSLSSMINFTDHITQIINLTSTLEKLPTFVQSPFRTSQCEVDTCSKTQAVKPMIDGHVIFSPTISLRRLQGTTEELRRLTSSFTNNDSNQISRQSNENDQSGNNSGNEDYAVGSSQITESYQQSPRLSRISEEHTNILHGEEQLIENINEPSQRAIISGIFRDVRVYLSPTPSGTQSENQAFVNKQRGSRRNASKSTSITKTEYSSGLRNKSEVLPQRLLTPEVAVQNVSQENISLNNSLLLNKQLASSTPRKFTFNANESCSSCSYTSNLSQQESSKSKTFGESTANRRSSVRFAKSKVSHHSNETLQRSKKYKNISLSNSSILSAHNESVSTRDTTQLNVTQEDGKNGNTFLAILGLAPSPSNHVTSQTSKKRKSSELNDVNNEAIDTVYINKRQRRNITSIKKKSIKIENSSVEPTRSKRSVNVNKNRGSNKRVSIQTRNSKKLSIAHNSSKEEEKNTRGSIKKSFLSEKSPKKELNNSLNLSTKNSKKKTSTKELENVANLENSSPNKRSAKSKRKNQTTPIKSPVKENSLSSEKVSKGKQTKVSPTKSSPIRRPKREKLKIKSLKEPSLMKKLRR